jgi:hypothetical protein
MVWKARVRNDPLQLDITETGVSFQQLPYDPAGPPVHYFLHKHRHCAHDGAEYIIISKFKNLLRVTLTSSTGGPDSAVRDLSPPEKTFM